jgi:hypothetical protein
MFGKMSPGRKVAKLQEMRLCFFCFRHSRDAECFARRYPDYKGCEENGCGEHHHRSLHWQAIVGRLFQIDVQPECHEPGAQVFTLRQNLKNREGSCNLAFDGGSDQTVVTEEYAKRMGFWKLKEGAAVVGFGETTPLFADVYEIAVTERAGKQHYLEAVAVPRIHTGPAARCPQDLRYRFLRIYNPPAEEMHQTGEDTDICIGANHWELLPTYVEQQLWKGPLHIYRSAFGCGYIVRGVEPPPKTTAAAVEPGRQPVEVDEPVDEPTDLEEPEEEGAAPEAAGMGPPPMAAPTAAMKPADDPINLDEPADKPADPGVPEEEGAASEAAGMGPPPIGICSILGAAWQTS